MLSVLSAKEESLMDLDYGTEDIMTMDYSSIHNLAWQACTSRLIQKAFKSTSVQGSDARPSSLRSSVKQSVVLLIEKQVSGMNSGLSIKQLFITVMYCVNGRSYLT